MRVFTHRLKQTQLLLSFSDRVHLKKVDFVLFLQYLQNLTVICVVLCVTNASHLKLAKH